VHIGHVSRIVGFRTRSATGGQRIDHVGVSVSDYERSKAFYEQALAPLGVTLLLEPVAGVGGFGEGQKP